MISADDAADAGLEQSDGDPALGELSHLQCDGGGAVAKSVGCKAAELKAGQGFEQSDSEQQESG